MIETKNIIPNGFRSDDGTGTSEGILSSHGNTGSADSVCVAECHDSIPGNGAVFLTNAAVTVAAVKDGVPYTREQTRAKALIQLFCIR
ncbi:MAG: hypothetical protein FWD92_03480 [Methanomassiliicoccaceae archaeon]|nr:hypothetical protein [Methanomassiliicoccaceae archaeon]